MNEIVIHRGGGPDVLQYEGVPDPTPGPGQILINVAAAGIIYSDIGARRRASSGDLKDGDRVLIHAIPDAR
jgi:NADPH:quinone reductase-like Zn-dependent oxidoreductase